MKKIIVSICFLFLCSASMACDICGCGVGNYYIGILPEFNKKIAGIRYRHNTLKTHLGAGGRVSYLTTDETYRTTEIWGGWTIGKKFRVLGYVPYNFNEKHNQSENRSKTGLGDIGLQAFYKVFSGQRTTNSKLMVHSLWLGAGVKLPTGNYDAAEKNNVVETANIFQLGTGSTDFTFNLMYDLRIMDAGLNVNASYKINTENAEGYRYGNKLSTNLQTYYKFKLAEKVSVAPNTGISFETAQRDLDRGFKMDVSGGNITMCTFGAELLLKKFSIGANWQTPVSQNLANGFVKANNRAMAHISFMF